MSFPIFDSADAIPEGFREAYVEKDGKWHPAIEDVTPLRRKADELLSETKAERKKRQDLEAKLAALEAEREAQAAGLTAEKLAEIQGKAEAKYKPVVDENAALKQRLRTMQLDATVKSVLTAKDVIDPDAAWKIVSDDFDLTDDGKAILKSDPTADLEQYVAGSLKQRYPFLFKGTQADGGGAAGMQKGSGHAGTKPVTQWTSTERQAFIEANGAEAHAKLLQDYQRDALKPKAA